MGRRRARGSKTSGERSGHPAEGAEGRAEPQGDGRARAAADALYYVLLAALVLLGAWIICSDLDAMDLDPDEYNLQVHVNEDFFSYLKNGPRYPVGQLIVYWISDRVLGESFALHRAPSAAIGVANMIAVLWFLNSVWPKRRIAVVTAGVLLSGNQFGLLFFRWGLPNYALFVFFSSLLYFLFMELARGPISKRMRLAAIPMLLLLNLAHYGLMIPFGAGAAAAFAFRMAAERGDWLRRAGRLGAEMSFLAIVPACFLLQWMTSVGESFITARPSLWPYDFARSGHEQTLSGALRFGWENCIELHRELLRVNFGLATSRWRAVQSAEGAFLAASAALLLASAVWTILQRPADCRRKFTLAYGLGLLGGIYALGLLGLYRYGTPRYNIFLWTPWVALIGLGASEAADIGIRAARRARAAAGAGMAAAEARLGPGPQIAAAAAAILAVAAVGWSCGRKLERSREEIRARDRRGVEMIRTDRSDLMLYDNSCAYFAEVLRKGLPAQRIGNAITNKGMRPVTLPGATQEALADPKSGVQRLFILAWTDFSAETYPACYWLVQENFRLERREQAGRIEGSWYVRRTEGGAALPTRLGISQAKLSDDGKLSVRGWILADYPYMRMDVYANGVHLGRAAIRERRPDIEKVHPEFGDSSSGFSVAAPAPGVQTGPAEIRVETYYKGELKESLVKRYEIRR